MKTSTKVMVGLLVALLLPFGCTDPRVEAPTIRISSIYETSYMLNWTLQAPEELQAMTILLSSDKDFNRIIQEIKISPHYQGSKKINGLSGVMDYWCKIIIVLLNGQMLESNTAQITTSCQHDPFHITTTDGVTLAGNLYYLSSRKLPGPGLIFMHDLGDESNKWKDTDILRRLIGKGYRCMTFDFRGHGRSSYWPLPPNQTEDPHQIEAYIKKISDDLKSILSVLRNHERVDPLRIGLLGTSLGANLALSANSQQSVKVSVAISPGRLGLYYLDEKLVVQNALFIVGEGDRENNDLWDLGFSECPKKIMLVSNGFHSGWPLLDGAGVEDGIIDWIEQRMKNQGCEPGSQP